eukprot:SAG31_NODE_29030_length_402_cov_0.511551_1_plen_113_part_01
MDRSVAASRCPADENTSVAGRTVHVDDHSNVEASDDGTALDFLVVVDTEADVKHRQCLHVRGLLLQQARENLHQSHSFLRQSSKPESEIEPVVASAQIAFAQSPDAGAAAAAA